MQRKHDEHTTLVLSKLTARIKAIDLMVKHKGVQPATDNERSTLDRVKSHINAGGKYSTANKGFVSTPVGVVVCLV